MRNNKGETMMEMIISIAIFSLMMVMISTIFTKANTIEVSNFEARNDMNEKLTRINDATPQNAASKGLHVSNGNTVVQVSINGKKGNVQGKHNFKVYELRTEDDTFIKIVGEKPGKNNGNNGKN